MGDWTKKEYALIEALEEHAIDTTTYSVSCAFCDKSGEKDEYPSGAAANAFKSGFTLQTLPTSPPETYVICKECKEKEAWK